MDLKALPSAYGLIVPANVCLSPGKKLVKTKP